MSIWDEFRAPAGDDLIQNGRYLIAGKRYTRCTTFVGAIDNAWGLTAWKQRMTAQGVAQSGALRAELLASLDDREALDRLCEDAIKVAGGAEKRDLGSAVHALTELVDEGRCPDLSGDPVLEHAVTEYQRLIAAHELEVVESEQVVVCDALGVAGRFDRLVNWDGKLVVLDIKTGKLKPGSFARQFAIYAHAERIYDHATGEFRPMPPVDQGVALAVMLPVDATSSGELVAVDVAAGWEDALLCEQVRIRGHRERLKDLCSWPSPVHIHWEADPTADLEERIEVIKANAAALDVFRSRWPATVTAKPWPVAQLPAITRAVEAAETVLRTPPEAEVVRARAKALDPPAFAQVMAWMGEATDAGVRFSVDAGPDMCARADAMCALLEQTIDVDVARTVLGLAIGDEVQPSVRLGTAWAALTPNEATTVANIAAALGSGELTIDGDAVVGDALSTLLAAA